MQILIPVMLTRSVCGGRRGGNQPVHAGLTWDWFNGKSMADGGRSEGGREGFSVEMLILSWCSGVGHVPVTPRKINYRKERKQEAGNKLPCSCLGFLL